RVPAPVLAPGGGAGRAPRSTSAPAARGAGAAVLHVVLPRDSPRPRRRLGRDARGRRRGRAHSLPAATLARHPRRRGGRGPRLGSPDARRPDDARAPGTRTSRRRAAPGGDRDGARRRRGSPLSTTLLQPEEATDGAHLR